MRVFVSWFAGVVVFGVSALVMGCGDKPSENAAPTATAFESAKPASAAAIAFVVDTASSKAAWTMEAPFEKIFGEIAAGISGDLFIDPSDLTKTTGLLNADLGKLDLFQQKRKDEKGNGSFDRSKHPAGIPRH